MILIGDLVAHQGEIKRVVHSYPTTQDLELVHYDDSDSPVYTFASYLDVDLISLTTDRLGTAIAAIKQAGLVRASNTSPSSRQ